MFKTLFIKWWHWVNCTELLPSVIGEEPPPIVEEVSPTDIWQDLFKLAEELEGQRIRPLGVRWFDHKPTLFTDSFGELVGRLEMLARCIETQSDAPDSWEERRREAVPVSIPDYSYDLIVGYRAPQVVMDMLIEKVMVIHHLLDTLKLSKSDSYSVYLRRTFHSVIIDTIEVLTAQRHEVVKSEE